MNSRLAIEMAIEERAHFLESARTAILVTIGLDGLPHPVAMWYVVRDGAPWFASYRKSQKVVNAMRHPPAAVLVEQGETYAEMRGVLLRGTAQVSHDAHDVLAVERALGAKYRGASGPLDAAEEERLRAFAAKRSVIVVTPVKVASWDHRKLEGGRKPLHGL